MCSVSPRSESLEMFLPRRESDVGCFDDNVTLQHALAQLTFQSPKLINFIYIYHTIILFSSYYGRLRAVKWSFIYWKKKHFLCVIVPRKIIFVKVPLNIFKFAWFIIHFLLFVILINFLIIIYYLICNFLTEILKMLIYCFY